MHALLKRTLVLVSLLAPFRMSALAQDTSTAATVSATDTLNAMDTADSPVAPGNKIWDVSLGGGALVRPTYEGSDRYRVSPAPFVTVTYNDFFSLGINGLNVYWHENNFRVGGGLTFSGGRKDTEQNGLFEQGDSRLQGLGNIDPALGVRAFASYDVGLVDFGGSVTKFTRSGNDGVLVTVGASLPYKVTERLVLTPHLGATWANTSYMQSYFGVTAAQAADSMFPQFSAGSGVKDVGAGVNAIYRLDRHWFLGLNANFEELTGAAAKSPISISNSGAVVIFLVGYHFK